MFRHSLFRKGLFRMFRHSFFRLLRGQDPGFRILFRKGCIHEIG